MPKTPRRRPFALANWKMAMTIGDTLAFAEKIVPMVETYSHLIDIVICPPYTALYALSQTLAGTGIHVGAQNVCTAVGSSHTGEVSPGLLADAGCRWVMLGHWEVRRNLGERDADVNQKMIALFQWNLHPILLLGEGSREKDRLQQTLAPRLVQLFNGCEPEQVASTVLIYEPEWTIGGQDPAPPQHIASGCKFLRQWLEEYFGTDTAGAVRVIYGGGVTPAHAKEILASPHVDGLGAGREGRDAAAFAEIVRSIASEKGLDP